MWKERLFIAALLIIYFRFLEDIKEMVNSNENNKNAKES